MSKSTTYKTDKPQVSDATIARIRAAAHRYVLAGGSIFPNGHDLDQMEHVGNVLQELKTDSADTRVSDLLEQTIADFATHERVYEAVWNAINNHADAAFLFGCFVGLETAALTFCQLATVPSGA